MTNKTLDRCTLVIFYEWTCRINQTARPYEDSPCDTKANTSVARCEFTLVEGSPFALTRGRISGELAKKNKAAKPERAYLTTSWPKKIQTAPTPWAYSKRRVRRLQPPCCRKELLLRNRSKTVQRMLKRIILDNRVAESKFCKTNPLTT